MRGVARHTIVIEEGEWGGCPVWEPRCACGWTSRKRYTRQEAERVGEEAPAGHRLQPAYTGLLGTPGPRRNTIARGDPAP